MTAPGGVRVLHDRAALGAAVERLGAEVSAAYPDGVTLVGVLRGCLVLLADLVRRLSVPCQVDFLAVSAYRPGSGRVRLVKDLDADIGGHDVVLVHDIVDTGLTCNYLVGELARRGPATVEVCALFDRRVRRIVPLAPRFRGFDAPDGLLLGYGLDVGGRYRNLPFVALADAGPLEADPDAYVEDLYGR